MLLHQPLIPAVAAKAKFLCLLTAGCVAEIFQWVGIQLQFAEIQITKWDFFSCPKLSLQISSHFLAQYELSALLVREKNEEQILIVRGILVPGQIYIW